MKETAKEIIELVNSHYDKYHDMDDVKASINLASDKWSLKEIIGHLIDSASNNHQRFVRLHIDDLNDFPGYHYDWIKIEHFNLMRFNELLILWKQFNLLLAHIIFNAPENKLSNKWKADGQDFTMEFIMKDYLRHLKEHIKHFEERLAELENISLN
ncbi:MAG: hypothetical protein JW864_16550 [Spirochaetes bacterium]|nr:hypothetical protein [Spirochaetota bacterium]